jgi:hypothetical protein
MDRRCQTFGHRAAVCVQGVRQAWRRRAARFQLEGSAKEDDGIPLMSVKMKATLIALIVCLAPIIIIPIHRAHQIYHLSYSEVLYNLVVNHQFAPK